MSKYIAESIRIAVAKRADFRCGYCRRPEADSFIKYSASAVFPPVRPLVLNDAAQSHVDKILCVLTISYKSRSLTLI